MMMLMQGALRFMRQGKSALEAGQSIDARSFFSRATDVVNELAATLDPTRAPELCEQLADVYDFVALRLLDASLQSDPVAVDEALRVFLPVVESFQEAVNSMEAAR